MHVKTHTINHTKVAEIISDDLVIVMAEDVINLLGELYYHDVDRIIIYKKNIADDFFDLKNGLAGEILQKFSNYRMRLAIVGDFSQLSGKSIRDFIYESNHHKQINFVDTLAEALDRLSDSQHRTTGLG